MADKLMRAQVTIPLDSGIPEDAIVNTFHFDGDDALGLQSVDSYYDAVMTLLTGFYQAIDGEVFPSSVADEAVVRIYDLADPEQRIVRRQDTIPLTNIAADPMPNEVALCMSIAAAPAAGVNPQRRRGRIFLGPIANTKVVVIGGQARPQLAMREAVAAAAATMAEGELLNIGDPERVRWAIYSPTTDEGGATLGDSFFDVVSGWIDDAWDTQRRRGAAPTARVTF